APTFRRGEDAESETALRRIWLNDTLFIAPFNMLGLPVASVPVGLVDGDPVGCQLISSRYREDVALAAAEAVEAGVGVLTRQLWAREA
ncbi:MAG: amidase family protein, partial [Pseudomonadota bacterium]